MSLKRFRFIQRLVLNHPFLTAATICICVFAALRGLLANAANPTLKASTSRTLDDVIVAWSFNIAVGIYLTCLCLILYRYSRYIIILHPLNQVWNPADRLREKTLYRYEYRSLEQLTQYKSRRQGVLIPIADEFATQLCENGDQIRKNNYRFMTCPSKSVIHALSDKLKLADHPLQQYLPKTFEPENAKYPCIVKYKVSVFGRGVFLVNDPGELTGKTRGMVFRKDYIIQEAILDSREYSTQFLVKDGKIIFHSSYFTEHPSDLFVWPRVKTISVRKHRLDPNGEVFDAFRNFFSGYNGLINCNYKFQDGQVKILEFNPRLTGDIYCLRRSDLIKLIRTYCEQAH